jgi:hypothetical protein
LSRCSKKPYSYPFSWLFIRVSAHSHGTEFWDSRRTELVFGRCSTHTQFSCIL